MQANDIMTTEVISVQPDTPVPAIAETLQRKRVSALPVIDDENHVIGIVSEDDLIHREEFGTDRRPSWWLTLLESDQAKANAFLKSHGRTAADVMTREVLMVSPDTKVPEIARLLEKHGIKRVPVVRNGKLVGIVSRANLLQALGVRGTVQAPTPDDQSIRRQILRLLQEEAGLSRQPVRVIVSDGSVHLWGVVETEDERRAAVVAAESLSGVKNVEDNLNVLGPMPGSTA